MVINFCFSCDCCLAEKLPKSVSTYCSAHHIMLHKVQTPNTLEETDDKKAYSIYGIGIVEH